MPNGPRRSPRRGRPNRSLESTQPAATSEPFESTAATQADGSAGEGARPLRALLTWVTVNIRRLFASVAAILGAGFALIFILKSLCVIGCDPEIQTLGLLEVNRLQEVELVGRHLDLVTAVFLTDDQQTRLYVRPENESLLKFIVPRGVKPDQEYSLAIKWKSRVPFAITHTLVPISPTVYVDSGTIFLGCGEEKIMFAGLNWDSVQLQNEIAKFIIENGYECETDALPGRPTPL